MSHIRCWRRFLVHCIFVFPTLLAASDNVWAADPDAPATAPLAIQVAPPKFVGAWGQKGTGDGQFKSPIGIAINAADVVFVTDGGNNCLQQFTSDGRFLAKVVTGAMPGGIAIDREGLIYVALMVEHKISVFRIKQNTPQSVSDFELVREWGEQGTEDGQFNQPGGLVFGLDGSLYVCDQKNHRMQRFASDGRFLSKWGGYGAGLGQFAAPEPAEIRVGGPCMAAIDREGNLFTTEPAMGRIQKFSPDGKYLASWGSNEPRDGAFGGARAKGPIAIVFDRHDRAWVSATNHRVQLFTAAGHYLERVRF